MRSTNILTRLRVAWLLGGVRLDDRVAIFTGQFQSFAGHDFADFHQFARNRIGGPPTVMPLSANVFRTPSDKAAASAVPRA